MYVRCYAHSMLPLLQYNVEHKLRKSKKKNMSYIYQIKQSDKQSFRKELFFFVYKAQQVCFYLHT